ncbi:hypothetical protein PVAND_013213 [Polypedilum vanderplanki]|uniref:Inhibitor of growth protein n=1 Tax=Polypedilum vanderplanki TaxID=319348 RepID=A0A9J6CQR8_POLVA|nr:hypothetical protein PVAND_013213 [Polypedilum vanderplanki]
MMLNQNFNTEALSGLFLKNYIEFIEEFPNDIQKCISKCREVDYKTKTLTCDIEKICEQILSSSSNNDKKARIKMQTLLAKLTELKDEKIHLSQSLATLIETKHKIVVDSFQNNIIDSISTQPPTEKISINPNQNTSASTAVKPLITTTVSAIPSSILLENSEKSTKRVRKTRIDNLDVDSFDDNLLPPIKSTVQSSQSTSANVNKRVNSNNSAKKAKKRKVTKKQINSQIAQEAVDEVIQDDGIDPDETTYCICQQISYGEMIFCENDTCPIEWFHFSCVDLTSKPKGRWFCPQCRGDKASVINKNLRKKQQESSAI